MDGGENKRKLIKKPKTKQKNKGEIKWNGDIQPTNELWPANGYTKEKVWESRKEKIPKVPDMEMFDVNDYNPPYHPQAPTPRQTYAFSMIEGNTFVTAITPPPPPQTRFTNLHHDTVACIADIISPSSSNMWSTNAENLLCHLPMRWVPGSGLKWSKTTPHPSQAQKQ